MRFIVVLVLFSFIAYSSSYEAAEADPQEEFDPTAEFDELEQEEDLIDELSLLGDKLKYKCVEKYCSYRCRRFMKPPYTATCENNKCKCKRVKKE